MDKVDLSQLVALRSLNVLFREMGGYAVFLASLRQGKYLYISEATQEIDGYDSELHRQGGLAFIRSIIHPEDYAAYMLHFGSQLNQVREEKALPAAAATYTYRIRHAQGHYCWITNTCTLLDAGGPDRVLGFYRKSTPEKGRESFLLQQLQRVLPADQFRQVVAAGDQVPDEPNAAGSEGADAASLFPLPPVGQEPVKITRREMEILRHISNGLSDKEIASRLSISSHTAVNHRKNLIHKYGAKNTAELIKAASRSYWL